MRRAVETVADGIDKVIVAVCKAAPPVFLTICLLCVLYLLITGGK